MRKLREQSPDALANTVERTCEKTGFGRPTIYELMDTGKLRFIKKGRRRVITNEAIMDCLRQLEAETAASRAA